MKETEKEWLEIVTEINSIKDDIKESAKKIVKALDSSKDLIDIDSEFLEIMNGLGKIGTITSNAHRVNNYSSALSDAFSHARTDTKGIGKMVIKHFMNQVCFTGFDVIKKGNKFEISLPKIDFNFMKVG